MYDEAHFSLLLSLKCRLYTQSCVHLFGGINSLQDPEVRPLVEQSSEFLETLIPEIPLWIKNPDYDRVSYFSCFNFLRNVFVVV